MLADAGRLEALAHTGLLDTEAEPAFDRLTSLAARMCRAPVALVSLVDAERQFFKSAYGLPEPWASRRETSLDRSFCKHLVARHAPLVVADARRDPDLCTSRAIEDLGVVAYAGMPLTTRDGYCLGSFCVIDGAPRAWTEDELAALRDLGLACMTEIDLRTELHARRRAEAELLRAARRKDAFLGVLGHELRDPLGALNSGIEVLRLGAAVSDAERTETVERLSRQVEHLAGLVGDLLDIASIARGQVRLELERVDLAEVARRALEAARPRLDERGHAVEVLLDAPAPVHGDAGRLEQVAINLLVNAAKFTPEGGHVRLEVRRGGDRVRLAVRDDGVGIAPEDRKRIFVPYAQVERRDRAGGGLGLGLALVRQIVELHGGAVELASELGRGSEFAVVLPLSLEPVLPRALESRPVERVGARCAGVSVLLVEDQDDAARSLSLLLRREGCDVRRAATGAEALRLAREAPPDVVLLDIGLPDTSGYAVAREMRCDPALEDVRLFAMTGFGHEEARRRIRELGFELHLVKPIDVALLLDRLVRVAAERAGWSTP